MAKAAQVTDAGATRVRIPAPERERRTHAERRAETRARVIAAVIDSIGELGYQKTTTAEISRRAGVTWGAVQHHFGDKDGILMAVLEESFERFLELLRDPDVSEAPLAKRVSLFVDRSWRHFGRRQYRSTLEILLNLPPDLDRAWRAEVLESWSVIWSHYFPESPPNRSSSQELMRYTVSVLSGLAATRILEGQDAGARAGELSFLKDTLERSLVSGHSHTSKGKQR